MNEWWVAVYLEKENENGKRIKETKKVKSEEESDRKKEIR